MRRFFTVLSICLIAILVSSSQYDCLTPFLRENNTPLDLDQLDLSLMAQDFAANDVYLSGAEWHGTKASYSVHLALLKALHQQAGVRYMLLGTGYATGQMYNAYLQSGDEEILMLLHEAIRFSNSSNEEHRMFWKNLYQFNQTLPAEERITVIGIDLEYLPYVAIHYLLSLPGADQLSQLYPDRYLGTTENLDNYVSALQTEVAANQSMYQETLGESFAELEAVLNNLADTAAANRNPDFYTAREQVLYQNFLRTYQRFPQGKFFGQWTMEHIYQRPASTPVMARAERLGMLLNQEGSPVQDRVLSIAATYMNSKYRFYWGRFYELDIEEELLTDLNAFRELAKTDYTLFRLTGEGSPFSEEGYVVKEPFGWVTTDYFQYLLVIKNSLPTSPNSK